MSAMSNVLQIVMMHLISPKELGVLQIGTALPSALHLIRSKLLHLRVLRNCTNQLNRTYS